MEKVPLTKMSESRLSMSQKSLPILKDDATAAQTEIGDPSKFQMTVDLTASSKMGNSLFFRDGVRRIDFILAYSTSSNKAKADKRAARRGEFESSLMRRGIDFEHELPSSSMDGKTGFVKLHGPWSFLETQAEAMKIRMPLRGSDMKIRSRLEGMLERVFKYNPFKLPDKAIQEEPQYYTAVYDRRYTDQFVMKSKETFFTTSQRSRMLWDALLQAEFGKHGEFGIKQLLEDSTYDAAYPLHEEIYSRGEKPKIPSERHVLYEYWAHPCQFYKYQPLSLIRKYFGEKITIYFAWLGFYTKALIPAAFAGFICMFYGLAMLNDDEPSADICDEKGIGNRSMCPSVPVTKGTTWALKDSCVFARTTFVFDNIATVIFAAFMSIWATMFLEGWKRRQVELAWDWDMHDADMEEEALRPEYVRGVKTLRRNPVTGEDEPYLPLPSRILRMLSSCVTVIFFLCLVLAIVFSIIVYRVVIMPIFDTVTTNANSIVLTSMTSATINLAVILALDYFYQWLAWHLTYWECPRTDQQFEDSYTFKVFLFQFINYYSSLFYIAFFKGRFLNVTNQSALLNNKYDEACDPAGCMVELFIQLGIIMVGKQTLCNITEILIPVMCNWWRRTWRSGGAAKSSRANTRWEKDYYLNELPDMAMFGEYLEMVLQYGFVTLFVAAFPLAPFFALINNIVEVRLDAYKFLGTYRRPMPARAKDLGAWYRILDAISHLAVLTNACVIAFTSDFVPQMFYKFSRSDDMSLKGYVNYMLSIYDARSQCPNRNESDACEKGFCYYKDIRLPPCTLNNSNFTGLPTFEQCDNGYSYAVDWWSIMVARLAFVLIFEHVVFLFKGIMAYLIPDVPQYIAVQMQRENHLTKQALYNRAYAKTDTGKTDIADPALMEEAEIGRAPGTSQSGKKIPAKGSNRSDEVVSKKKRKFPARRL